MIAYRGGGNKANEDHASATAASPVPNVISDAIKKAKVAAAATAEADKVRDEGGQGTAGAGDDVPAEQDAARRAPAR